LRTGVIRDIPVDIDDEIVKRYLVSQNKIIEVNRLMRQTIKDGKSELIPSKFLCIKFSGQMLPKYVSLFHTRHAVSTFIPKVRICYNCFRAGHISKSCRSNARCVRYGEPPHANSQECSMQDVPPRCINCNGSHLPPLLTTAHWSLNTKDYYSRRSGEHLPFSCQKKNFDRTSNF
ncbi:hypothetical protein ALC57_03021, partial [Trachymyrmex cornetzi]